MTTRRLTAAILTALLLAACSTKDSRWTGTMEDSAGVTLVTNTDIGIWRPGEEWTLVEELRIGAVDGDPAYEFGVIVSGGVAVDSRGRIFALDAQAQEIRVFSGRGEYLQTIGGQGGGPGEFAGAREVRTGPGDTLFVPDRRNQRMNRFAPDGSFVGSSRFSREDGLSIAFRVNSSGAIVEQVRPFFFSSSWPDNPQDIFVTWASDGTRSDTFAVFRSGREMAREGGAVIREWYAPETCWDLTNDMRLLIGANDEYSFQLLSPGGRLDRVITKAHEPQRIRDQDIDRVKSHMEKRWSHLGAPPDQIRRLWDQQHFNEFFPAFRALYEGPAGTIWVHKVKPPSQMTEDETQWFTWPSDWGSRDWDVFDPQGRYLGLVTMPPRFTPSLFRDDRVYGIWLDELGVSYVLQLRIVGT